MWPLLALVLLACGGDGATGPPEPSTFVLTVEVTGRGEGTVTSDPAGIDCASGGGECSASFEAGTVVALSAAPAPGDEFAGWSGPCEGTEPCTVTMGGSRTVGAAFGNPDLVVREIGPAGGEIASVDGRLTLAIPAGALAAPESISVDPIDPAELGPEFDDLEVSSAWELGPDGLEFSEPVTATVLTDRSPTRGDTLTVQASALVTSEDGSVAPLESLSVEAEADDGTVRARGRLRHFSKLAENRLFATLEVRGVPLTADAGSEWFVEIRVQAPLQTKTRQNVTDRSSDPVQIKDPSTDEFPLFLEALTFLRRATYRCAEEGTGRFGLESSVPDFQQSDVLLKVRQTVVCVPPPRLTVEFEGDGQGRVVSDPSGIDCSSEEGACAADFDRGTEITLTATPNEGSEFCGWATGVDTEESPTVKLTLERDGTITACFELVPDDGGGTTPARPALLLGRTRTASDGTTYEAGSDIGLDRITGGFVLTDNEDGCQEGGAPAEHMHDDAGDGIFIDGKGPFFESDAEQNGCGFGKILR